MQDNSNTAGQDLPVGRGWSELLKQVLLVGCAMLFYFGVRGVTEGSADIAIENGLRVLAFEERFSIDVELALQELIEDSRFLLTLANWTYIWLHWPVIIITLVMLHRRERVEYLLLRNAMFISGGIGLFIFMAFPVAPPRLLDAGFIDTVTEYSTSYRVFQPPGLVNKYAAVPSLHVGWNLLIGIALYRTVPAMRVFAILGPLAMSIAVVATGNHYVIDGFIGAALALLGLAIATRITPTLAQHPFDPFREARKEPAEANSDHVKESSRGRRRLLR